jgi:hypothetical protein
MPGKEGKALGQEVLVLAVRPAEEIAEEVIHCQTLGTI